MKPTAAPASLDAAARIASLCAAARFAAAMVGSRMTAALLELLDHVLVLGRCGNRVHAERRHLDAAQVRPGVRKLLVERLGELFRVRWYGAVAHAHRRDSRKRRLQGGQQLAFKLPVDLLASVRLFDVAAHVFVEEQRIDDAVGVRAVAAHGDVHVESDVGIDYAEGHGGRRAVLVVDDFFCVEEIDPLVLAGVAAKGKARAKPFERLAQALAQRPRLAKEQARLGRRVEHELAGLAACLDDRALLDDRS